MVVFLFFLFFKPTRKGEHLCKCTELSLKRKEGIHRNISSKFVFLDVYNISPDRAINYDEKDPFLCNACGFCKYAKFDFTLTAKPCCAVDPIETEEDRKKVSLYLYLPQHWKQNISEKKRVNFRRFPQYSKTSL